MNSRISATQRRATIPPQLYEVASVPTRLPVKSSGVKAEATRLSSSVTVARYKALVRADDRRELARFFRERFEERYFRPLFATSPSDRSGFAFLAVGCLVIETLEAFYKGLPNTKYKSQEMFREFFKRPGSPLGVFASEDDWFYRDIRCGILHQAEVGDGWRVLRIGDLCSHETHTINAYRFLREVEAAVARYSMNLESDEICWSNFRRKMAAVCNNCNRATSL